MQDGRAGRRVDAALLCIILLVATAVGLLWLYSVPFHKAPDEGAHYQVVRFIRDYGRLPLFSPDELWLIRTPTGVIETYATFPPLAYIVSAVAGWLTHDGSMWPARFVSFGSYLGTVALTFWIGRRVFPQVRSIAACGALAVALLPQFAFTGGYVNNDAFAVLETAILLALLVSAWQSGARPFVLLAIGITAGALAMTKYTFYGVAGIGVVAAVALALWERPRRRPWLGLAALGGGTLATCGWWFVRNLELYGQAIPGRVIAEAKAAEGGSNLFVPVDHGINLLTLSTHTNFWELTLKSFVGAFGFMAIFLDAPYYWAALAVALLGVAGLLLRARRGDIGRRPLAMATLVLAMIGVTLLSTMVVNVYGEYSPQGRYLFPALVPVALALAGGWYWLGREVRLLGWLPSAAVLVIAVLNLGSLVNFVVPRHYGAHAEKVIVQVDRPSEPHASQEAIVIAGWSIVEGMSDWRPYAADAVSGYRHPAPGIEIYMGGPPGVGRLVAAARYGFHRPDVDDFYGGQSTLDQIGFWLQLPPGSLAPGRYQVYACAPAPSNHGPICSEKDLEVL
jgi:4-amino-4-deoxy-L-arabinose transferase-like glycosyltransferase